MRIVKRVSVPWYLQVIGPVAAFVLTMLIGAVLLAVLGFNAREVLYNFFVLSLTGTYQQAELFVKAAPLVLIAIGLAVGYKANIWNIGAEGQFLLGAITGGITAIWLGDSLGWAGLIVASVAAIAGGAAWAAIPAFLRDRMNASELLTSLMLVYVGQQLLFYLVAGPLKDPYAFSWPKSSDFESDMIFPILVSGTRFHMGIIIAAVLAFLTWIVLSRSHLGFQIRVAGSSPRAGQFSGFTPGYIIWVTLLFSGACAGLAGYIEAANNVGHLSGGLSVGYGFTAIIVAFLGRLNPIGIVVAGLLLALTFLGGETVQTFNQVPKGLTLVLQALLLFLVLASEIVLRYRIARSDSGRAPA